MKEKMREYDELKGTRFKKMKKVMKILVTGSSGFIGSHLVEHLVSQNYESYSF